MIDNYITFVSELIGGIVLDFKLNIISHGKSDMGEWYVRYENNEFIVGIWQDRSGYVAIELGSKIRRKPKSHMRGPWSLSHLRGYLEGSKVHFDFQSPKEEAEWFENNENKLFDSSFLNSDDLNKWAVKASKRLWG